MQYPRNFVVVTLVLLQLIGCSDQNSTTSSGSGAPFPPGPAVTVTYVPAAPNPQIDIVATNFAPLASAELVLSDGRNVRTEAIQREFVNSGGGGVRPSIGIGGFGSSGGGFGTGIGLGFPLGGSAPPPAAGPIRSRTRLAIPDAADYAADWQKAVVRLRFGTPPAELSVVEVPAPPPVQP
jgi:hypothetical protein